MEKKKGDVSSSSTEEPFDVASYVKKSPLHKALMERLEKMEQQQQQVHDANSELSDADWELQSKFSKKAQKFPYFRTKNFRTEPVLSEEQKAEKYLALALLYPISQEVEAEGMYPLQQEPEADQDEAERHTYKYSLLKYHPDLLRVTRKIRPDSQSPNGQKEFFTSNDNDDGYEDDDIQSGDKKLYCIPCSSKWLSICLEEWGFENDDNALRSKVRAAKHHFEIFTAGFCCKDGGAGCGAIIRDKAHRPIVARSSVISGKVSQFCLELEGVALGVELAVKYEVLPFYFCCSSDEVELFLSQFLGQRRCICSGERKVGDDPCKVCMRQWMIPDEHDKASQIIKKIISNVSKLKDMGLTFFNVTSGGNGFGGGYNKGSAYVLAQQRKDQELKVKEIGELKVLWDAIYEEVFGQYDDSRKDRR